MSKREVKQFRMALTTDELRAINSDAAARGLDRVAWFTLALRESESWRRLFPKGSK